MPSYRSSTSGTTGQRKTYQITDELLARRIAHMSDASRGDGFEACKSLFIDWAPTSYWGIAYSRYAEQHGMKCHCASHGTIEATVEFFKNEGIEGITATPQGLYNYAKVINGTHQFKWMLASTSRLTPGMSASIRAGMGSNLWSSYAATEIGIISIASAEQIETIPNCVGRIVPDIEVRFEDGEILLKSDLLISGYEDRNLPLDADGWYHTGDLGHMQDGLLIMDGRGTFRSP